MQELAWWVRFSCLALCRLTLRGWGRICRFRLVRTEADGLVAVLRSGLRCRLIEIHSSQLLLYLLYLLYLRILSTLWSWHLLLYWLFWRPIELRLSGWLLT